MLHSTINVTAVHPGQCNTILDNICLEEQGPRCGPIIRISHQLMIMDLPLNLASPDEQATFQLHEWDAQECPPDHLTLLPNTMAQLAHSHHFLLQICFLPLHHPSQV